MRCVIIPDVHLKPKIFDQAHKLLEAGVADRAVVLGDLVDDWGEEFNLPLYARTMQKVLEFNRDHSDTLWCMGNHDWGYYNPDFGKRESGHSRFVEGEMRTWLDEFLRQGIDQRRYIIIDNCIFSHAGLNKNWLAKKRKAYREADLESNEVFRIKYRMLWEENSPIWWRPQKEYGGDPDEAWEKDKFLQVVGHSPVKTPIQEGSILSCDVFSTYRNGAPYGDQKWVVVDTETKEWEAKSLDGWLEEK